MAKDPVCHMDVNEQTAQVTSVYQGKTYYFCSPGCRRAFQEHPEKYLQNASVTVVDPVCKMTIEPTTAQATSTYEGTTYYFCSILCKRAFDENPSEFVTHA